MLNEISYLFTVIAKFCGDVRHLIRYFVSNITYKFTCKNRDLSFKKTPIFKQDLKMFG